MREYNDTLEHQEFVLEDTIKELDSVNKKLARFLLIKEELTEKIISVLGHNHDGQRTYEYRLWKIEVKTPCVYSLNKKLYETGDYKIPEKFNPIKESISYSIDKKMCEDALKNAPLKVKDKLIELIDKKPGKHSVSIKERV